MKYLSITFRNCYTCGVINKVHIEISSSSNSMNLIRIQNEKTQMSFCAKYNVCKTRDTISQYVKIINLTWNHCDEFHSCLQIHREF